MALEVFKPDYTKTHKWTMLTRGINMSRCKIARVANPEFELNDFLRGRYHWKDVTCEICLSLRRQEMRHVRRKVKERMEAQRETDHRG